MLDNVWPPDVTSFLALVDEIRHVATVPTVATHLEKGRLTLLLGRVWDVATHAERVEILRHEASHVAHGCWMRVGNRDKRLWNVATDAIIHALKEADVSVLDPALRRVCSDMGPDGGSVTLERLSRHMGRQLSLMPAERLYDVLQEAQQACGTGCGSGEHSRTDDSIESRLKAQQVGNGVLGAQAGKDAGYRGVPSLPSVPAWIADVLDWLVTRVLAPEDRCRSWRRDSRVRPGELPGYARTDTRAARFMLDASGSISDELVGQLLVAVCSTPELAGSDVVVFDHVCREPVPASDTAAVLDAVSRAGGGTLIRAAGAFRDPDKQTVWLTDGGTADGWPEGAEQDLWVVGPSDPAPAGAPVVRRA